MLSATRTSPPFRFLFLFLSLFLLTFISEGSAQNSQMPSGSPGTPSHSLPMKRTTNAERRSAARRNEQRKVAAGHKNQVIQTTKPQVKQ